MQGKTHLVVGITSALLIMQPNNFNELVMGIGAAAPMADEKDVSGHD